MSRGKSEWIHIPEGVDRIGKFWIVPERGGITGGDVVVGDLRIEDRGVLQEVVPKADDLEAHPAIVNLHGLHGDIVVQGSSPPEEVGPLRVGRIIVHGQVGPGKPGALEDAFPLLDLDLPAVPYDVIQGTDRAVVHSVGIPHADDDPCGQGIILGEVGLGADKIERGLHHGLGFGRFRCGEVHLWISGGINDGQRIGPKGKDPVSHLVPAVEE